jgi:hypothetical protein
MMLEAAARDLGDQDAIDAYLEALNEAEEAAGAAIAEKQFRPFQAKMAGRLGMHVVQLEDGAEQLGVDFEAIAARAGKIFLLHTKTGSVGKSYLMGQIEQVAVRDAAEHGSTFGSEGAKIGCVKISTVEDANNSVNLILKKFQRTEKDEKGKVVSKPFDPPEYVFLLVDLARAFTEQMSKVNPKPKPNPNPNL